MSADNPYQSDVDELTKCPICQKTFKDPRSLPCLHSFCFRCVGDHYRNISSGDNAECPVCRRVFKLPRDGFEGLRRDIFIKRLTYGQEAPNKWTDRIPCERCSDDYDESASDIRSVTARCSVCGQNLCEKCVKAHSIIHNEGHAFISLGNEATGSNFQSVGTICSLHAGYHLEAFCIDCNSTVCTKCWIGEHSKHNVSPVGDISSNYRKTIEEKERQLSDSEEQIRQQMLTIGDTGESFSGRIKDVEMAIRRAADDTHKQVDKAVRELTEELSRIRTAALNDIAKERDPHQFQLAQLQHFTR